METNIFQLKLPFEENDFYDYTSNRCVNGDCNIKNWQQKKSTFGLLRHDITKTLVKTENGFPKVAAYKGEFPSEIICFNSIHHNMNHNVWIHGFAEDTILERFWQRPFYYLNKIPKDNGFISLDFSIKLDMDDVEKRMNVYRKNAIAQIAQNNDIKTIHTLCWGEKETFEYCFDGIECGGIYALSNIGVSNNYISRKIFKIGLIEAINILKPKGFVLYGYPMDNYYGIDTRVYSNPNLNRLHNLRFK